MDCQLQVHPSIILRSIFIRKSFPSILRSQNLVIVTAEAKPISQLSHISAISQQKVLLFNLASIVYLVHTK